MSYAGRAGETPTPLPMQVADVGAGSLHLAIGLLSAVIRRQETGQGGFVDISMFDGSFAWNSLGIAHSIIGDTDPQQESMVLNGGIYYDFYRTRDDRYLSVGSLEPKFWAGFCQAIERPDLIEKGMDFTSATQEMVKTEVRQVMARKTLAEWMDIFAEIDVCVEPVLTTGETLQHPQTQARGLLVDVPLPDGSTQQQVGCPIKLSDFDPDYQHIGTDLGAHSRSALAEAGFSKEKIDELVVRGVVTEGRGV